MVFLFKFFIALCVGTCATVLSVVFKYSLEELVLSFCITMSVLCVDRESVVPLVRFLLLIEQLGEEQVHAAYTSQSQSSLQKDSVLGKEPGGRN